MKKIILIIAIMVMMCATVSGTYDATTDLQRWYGFNGDTKYLTDGGWDNATSVLVNTSKTLAIDGYVGRALNLTDSNTFITIPLGISAGEDDLVTNAGSPLAVSFAYKVMTMPNTNNILIFNTGTPHNFIITQLTDGRLQGQNPQTGDPGIVYSPTLNVSEWYFITVLNKGNNLDMELYINGVLQDSDSQTQGGGQSSSTVSHRLGFIGTDPVFHAIIDEFSMRETALTTSNVSELYALSLTISTSYEIMLQEHFGYSNTGTIFESDCSEDSYTSASVSAQTLFGEQSSQGMLNKWYCYVETANHTVTYSKTTTSTETDRGLKMSPDPDTLPDYSSLVMLLDSDDEVDMLTTDRIEFTCDLSQADDLDHHYLGFAQYSSFDRALISLKDDGCDNLTNNPYTYCCELSDVVGFDCTTGKTNIRTDIASFIDNCTEFENLDFQDIRRVDLWISEYNGSAQNLYFDDLKIFRETTTEGNHIPTINSVDPIPDPQLTNTTVLWTTVIIDLEDTSDEIWSAFDCDNDGTLDHNWSKRGTSISFNCTYPTEGTKNSLAWASDDFHYPQNVSLGSTVEIVGEFEVNETPTGGNCTGFSDPNVCTGLCRFLDEFTYSSRPISCVGWEGSASVLNPVSNTLSVFGTNATTDQFYIDRNITQAQYYIFDVGFDLTMSSNDILRFEVLDDELDDELILFIIVNYEPIAYDTVDPTQLNFGLLTQDQTYNFRISVNLLTDKATFYLDGVLVGTQHFYDGAVTSARQFIFTWFSTTADFEIDNFEITKVTESITINESQVVTDYTYNGDFFCAMNMTNPTPHLAIQNCLDRGYPPMNHTMGALCPIRACVDDFLSLFILWVRSNVLVVIILGTILILLLPLFIKSKIQK